MVLRMPSPYKHPKTGVYYFRIRVPVDLVAFYRKREIKSSLGTKDPAEAKRLFLIKEKEVLEEFTAARMQPEPLSHKQIMALAGEAYREFVEQMDEDPGEIAIWEAVSELNRSIEEVGQLEKWFGPSVDQLLLRHRLSADASSRDLLIREYARAIDQAVSVNRRKAEGDYSPDAQAGRYPKLATVPVRDDLATTVTLDDLLEAWRRDHEANEGAPGTVTDWTRIINEFADYLGHRDALRVRPKDVSDWCDFLKTERQLKPRTVKLKNLAAVRSVFRVGKSKSLVPGDPTEGVKVSVKKAKLLRSKGLTLAEAERILSESLRAPEHWGRTSRQTKLAYRWIPWLCAYTGARVGEMAQLRKEDFVVVNEIPCLKISPDAGTVKARQYRLVPVHPHLVEQGFLELLDSVPPGPIFYDPAAVNKSARKSPAGTVGDKVAKWVRAHCGLSDVNVSPNHGWRHRFKTVAEEADINPRYTDAIQGHDDGSASYQYGERSMVTLQREIMKLPRYEVTEPA